MMTSIFGGRALFLQRPKVPKYVIENQTELTKAEHWVTKCREMSNIAKVNANAHPNFGELMSYTLLLIPEGYLVYDPTMDDEPSYMNRTMPIAMRELANQMWVIDSKSGEKVHTIWWGHFTYCIIQMDRNRKIIAEKNKVEEGLSATFARGTTV